MPNRGRARVLVVDDFEDARELYSAYLAHLGYEVETANDGAQAVARARADRPDVIVMDLAMPVMDGWQAARELRGHDDTAHVRIIALSGHTTAENRRLAEEAGCDRFLSKPCLPSDLDRCIKELLATRAES